MGNSKKKPQGSVAIGKKKNIIEAQTVADAGATARGSKAVHTQRPRGGERHPYPGIEAARR